MFWKHREKDADSASIKETVMDLEKMGLSDEDKESIEKGLADLQAQIDELGKPEETVDDVLKGIPDKAKAEFEKQADRIAKMEADAEKHATELAVEKDARLVEKFTKAAESYTVLGDAKEAGPNLKTIAENEAVYKWLIEKVEAAQAIADTSPLFSELGAGDDGDPVAQIDELAKEKQKDNPELTVEQARILVRKERPDLRELESEGN